MAWEDEDYVAPSLLDSSKARTLSSNLGGQSNVTQGAKKFTDFNRFRQTEGEDYAVGGISYVFFTKPHLNLLNNKSLAYADSFLNNLKDLGTVGERILHSLDGGNSKEGGKFISLITNSAENFETKDTMIKTEEMHENFVGSRMIFPTNTNESQTVDQFNIEYTEYADLSITLLHKAWVDYMNLVKKGVVNPYRGGGNVNLDYVHRRIIDYMSSVYYFKLGEDGKKIKYWAKYTGVFPTNIPYSAFSYHHGDPKVKKVSVQYSYNFKEDMDYNILKDFQMIAGSSNATKGHVYTLKDNWKTNVRISNDFKHPKLLFE
jgi:hypothetical protein